METYCSIWVFLFCKHPMRAVLYKKISQSQSIRTLAYLFYTIGPMGCSPRNRKSRLTANHLDDRRNSSPLILVEMAKAVSERNEVECSFRLWQENISCQQHKSKTARNCEMLDWYVLLCQKRDEVP